MSASWLAGQLGFADTPMTSARPSIQKTTRDITTHISSVCGVGDTTTVELKNIRLTLSHIDCPDISLLMQTVNANTNCVQQNSAAAVAASMAAQMKRMDAGTSVTAFGGTFQGDDTDVETKLTETIKDACGSDNATTILAQNITVDMTDVTCAHLKVLTQHSSTLTACAIAGYAKAQSDNPTFAAQAAPSIAITTIGIVVAVAAAIAAIVAFAFVLHHGHHVDALHVAHARLLQQYPRAAPWPTYARTQ